MAMWHILAFLASWLHDYWWWWSKTISYDVILNSYIYWYHNVIKKLKQDTCTWMYLLTWLEEYRKYSYYKGSHVSLKGMFLYFYIQRHVFLVIFSPLKNFTNDLNVQYANGLDMKDQSVSCFWARPAINSTRQISLNRCSGVTILCQSCQRFLAWHVTSRWCGGTVWTFSASLLSFTFIMKGHIHRHMWRNTLPLSSSVDEIQDCL